MSEFFKTFKALNVISSKLPIGVETIYKWLVRSFIMKVKFFLSAFCILFVLSSNLHTDDNNKKLKVGLLAPLSGAYSEIGNSLLNSLQLALEEINDDKVIIVPRDSGYKNKEKLELAINEMRSLGIKVVIGPTAFEEFDQVKKYSDLIRYVLYKSCYSSGWYTCLLPPSSSKIQPPPGTSLLTTPRP